MDLYDLPDLRRLGGVRHRPLQRNLLPPPRPGLGLKLAADLTREVMILDTATRSDLPDGLLVIARESTERPMSGVYGLNWLPTGPKVLEGS